MPETAIGFIPDVGGTHLLGTAPGEIGTYMGLTEGRIGAADAIQCAVADVMTRSEDLPGLSLDLEACTDAAAMQQCLQALRRTSLAPCAKLQQFGSLVEAGV